MPAGRSAIFGTLAGGTVARSALRGYGTTAQLTLAPNSPLYHQATITAQPVSRRVAIGPPVDKHRAPHLRISGISAPTLPR